MTLHLEEPYSDTGVPLGHVCRQCTSRLGMPVWWPCPTVSRAALEDAGVVAGGDGSPAPGAVSASSLMRKRYAAFRLNHVTDEPFGWALLRYSRAADVQRRFDGESFNLVSSEDVADGTHLPIIDLDYSHEYVPSTTAGNAHLYLNVPISKTRWRILMFGLYVGKVIEPGFFWWSLRRGANFVRPPGRTKTVHEVRDAAVRSPHGFWRRRKPFDASWPGGS